VAPAASVDRVEEVIDDRLLGAIAATDGARERDILSLAARLAHGCDTHLAIAVDRARQLLDGRDAREVRGLVDAVVRGTLGASADTRAQVCEEALALLVTLGPGDGAAARAAVAEGRWGDSESLDGAALARAVRTHTPSSSLLSAK